MPFDLLVFLAGRSLVENPLIAALLVAAVAAGSGFQVANSSNLEGYRDALIEEGLVNSFGDVRVRPQRGADFEDGEGLAAELAKLPGVHAATAQMVVPGAISFAGKSAGGPVIAGSRAATGHPYRLIQGALPEGDGIVLGSALASRLGAHVGDTVRFSVLLQTGPTAFPEDALGRYNCIIRGIAGGAFGAHESIFVDRAFLGAEKSASIILVYAGEHRPEDGRVLAQKIQLYHPEAQARAWADDSAYLDSAIGSVKAVSAISHSMVVAAVAIPVLALLYIATLNRRKEVGVLAALGFSRREVFAIFLMKALLVALVGGAVGALGGMGLVRWFQAHPIFEYDGFIIRPRLSIECFVRPMGMVLMATVLAGVYPAWRASRVDPARVLKGID
jgi:ABC-type lipoprotein release transport system permease subunit